MNRRIAFLFAALVLILSLIFTLGSCGGKTVVSFQSNGGSEVSSQTLSDGYVKEPDAPIRAGYRFICWELRGEKFDFENTKVTENVTLVAKWEAIEYTVTFENCEGVTLPDKKTFTIDDGSYTLPENPERDGCQFLGWYEDADFTRQITAIDTSVCKDVTVYAKWSGGTISYLNWPDPDPNAPTTYIVGDEIILPVPDREHYRFIGWHYGAMSGEIITELDTSRGENVRLYAEWSPIEYTITYENCEGLTISLPKTYTVITADITLTELSRSHYRFLGWFTDEELTEAVTEIDCSEGGNITLYASFEYAPHSFDEAWSYDGSNHWHASNCGHEEETSDFGAHTLTGGICTVCGYDDGVNVIKELIKNSSLSSSFVTTSLDTGLANEPMCGEYTLTFNADGTVSIVYSYEQFTGSEDWIDSQDPYETVEGVASVDKDGSITGGVTLQILNTGSLKFNFTAENAVASTEANKITLTVKAEDTEAALGFACPTDVTVEFTVGTEGIDSLVLSYSADMAGTEVPVVITAVYTK